MATLNLDLVKELGLEIQATAMDVRRKNKSYALNQNGELIGVSFSESDLEELILAEDAQHLKHLYLAHNKKLRSIEFRTPLPELEHLYLNDCELENIHIPRGCLNLEQIYVQENKLVNLTFEGDCPELILIDASKNQLERLVMPNGFLKLLYFYLQDNKLEALPDSFARMLDLDTLYLSGNPLSAIPRDIVGTGDLHNSAKDIVSFLSSTIGKKTKHLHEAKMILIGNPMVGKSSIRIKLKDPAAELPTEKDRTLGLEIEPYFLDFPPSVTNLSEDINFQLNIWDFGGQGKYREVQQLFCSRKSMYLYVTSYDDSPKKEDYTGMDYWYSMVKAYSFDPEEKKPSPMIYVLNKVEVDDCGIDERQYKKQYENLVEFVKIDCKEYKGFEHFIKTLEDVLPQISKDIFSDAYGLDWFQVKEHLKTMGSNHLLYREYLEIAKKEGLDVEQAKTWLRVLDRIGSVIYFGDFEDPEGWIILNPIWVKDAICNVIDSNLLNKDGILRSAYFDAIWSQYPDEGERKNLIKLMLNDKYKLAYPILSDDGEQEYVVPSALFNKPKPDFGRYPHLQKQPDKQFKLIFEPFIPAGIVNKLMVSLNSMIFKNLIWGNGCILHDPASNSYIVLQEQWEEKTVHVDIFGDNPQNFYETLVLKLQQITQEIKDTRFLNHLAFIESIIVDGELMPYHQARKFNLVKWHKKNEFKTSNMALIEKEIEGLTETLELQIRKKSFFEKELVKASDAGKQFSLKEQLDELESDIAKNRNKIAALYQTSNSNEATTDTINKIDVLLQKTDQLNDQVAAMSKQVDAGFAAVLNKLSAQDKYLIKILTLSESHQTELAEFFVALDEKEISAPELEAMTKRIDEMLGQHLLELPAALTQQWKKLNEKSAEYTDAKGKIKLKLPIIPSILEYEIETNWDLKKVAKQIWADFKAGKSFLK